MCVMTHTTLAYATYNEIVTPITPTLDVPVSRGNSSMFGPQHFENSCFVSFPWKPKCPVDVLNRRHDWLGLMRWLVSASWRARWSWSLDLMCQVSASLLHNLHLPPGRHTCVLTCCISSAEGSNLPHDPVVAQGVHQFLHDVKRLRPISLTTMCWVWTATVPCGRLHVLLLLDGHWCPTLPHLTLLLSLFLQELL
jgi:hypothetical protein